MKTKGKPEAVRPSLLLPPWQVAQYGEHLRPVVVKGSHKIANFWTNENAAYAVKAVNAHAGMVRWLEAIASASPDSTVEGLKQGAREALRAADEAV